MFSAIDFEIWILLHFEPVNRSYSRKELVKRLSGEKYFNQEYKKGKWDNSSFRENLVRTLKRKMCRQLANTLQAWLNLVWI